MIWWPRETPNLYYGEITLRRANERDIVPIFTACQDPIIPKFTTVPSPYLMAHAEDFIRDIAPRSFAEKSEMLFAIVFGKGDEEQFCGLISFHTTSLANHTTELGYWLAKESRGKGIGKTAIALLTEYGIGTMGFRRIEALVDVDNVASKALLTSVGYNLDGILRNRVTRRDGVQIDMALFSKISD
ncbi:MAG: GNAT family N-acetyltransferase [Actinobacteria bacterium]|nr:GNAT family N-acetyltransferase [Actinomycetota bacterium]